MCSQEFGKSKFEFSGEPVTVNAIALRLAAATPGPWNALSELDGSNLKDSIYGDDWKGLLIARCNQNGAHDGDTALLVNAPSDIALLLSELAIANEKLLEAEKQRDSHGETIVQLAADLERVSDDVELHRVAYKAANDELQDIYATIRPIQTEGNVKAVDVYKSLLDANATLRVQLNAAVRAREIFDEERTSTAVKAVGLAAKNHALREEREHIKSVVWTLNNALTTYHDFTSELLEAQRLASQIPGLYASDDEPEPTEVVVDVKFDSKATHAALVAELRKDPRMVVTSSDEVPSL